MVSMRSRILAPILFLLATSAQGANEFYCCHDPSSGRRVCGDTLPEQCRGRAYRVLDSGGNIVKEVGPPLTAEQKAEQALENRRKKKQEEADRELRRRDQALLDTYSTPEDIDLAQKKAEADVNFAILAAIARIDTAQSKRKKFADEAEFYKKKTLPPDLDRELKAIDHEIRLQQELLDLKKKDFETIKAKYDADRKRYFELTRRPPAASGTATPGR
jgi:hypothetical protein